MRADPQLPPLLLIKPVEGLSPSFGDVDVDVDGVPAALSLHGDNGGDECEAPVRLLSFGVELVRARRARGVTCSRVVLRAAPTGSPAEVLAVPHLFAWRTPGDVCVAWEELSPADAVQLLDAPEETIARWAARAPDLERLARAVPAVDSEPGAHLSFRWVLANERVVAALLSRRAARFGHVSMHLTEAECAVVLRVFTEVLGLVEVTRPSSIRTPGHWLQCGEVSVHLSTRARRPGDVDFPGMAPNHVCFVVADLDGARERLAALGFESVKAGSLGNQLWFRLPGGHAVELQAGLER